MLQLTFWIRHSESHRIFKDFFSYETPQNVFFVIVVFVFFYRESIVELAKQILQNKSELERMLLESKSRFQRLSLKLLRLKSQSRRGFERYVYF